MLFGRPARNEIVGIDELGHYLDGCFDDDIRKISSRMPRLVEELGQAFSDFGASVREFSEKETKPDMGYLYGIKEGFVTSQRPNYTSHITRIASASPELGGNNLYAAAKKAADSYGSIILEVLKANNTFKVVIIGYAGGLKDVKRHFNDMERLHKDLKGDIDLCEGRFKEYNAMRSMILNLTSDISRVANAGNLSPMAQESIQTEINDTSKLRSEISELEKEHESANGRRNEAASSITRMLLPMERIARKHDHMSASKRKLSDYIDEPKRITKDAESLGEFRRQVSSLIEEVRAGKIEVRNPNQTVSQLNAARDADLMALADSLHEADLNLERINGRLARARELRSIAEKANEDEKRRKMEEDEAQRSIEELKSGMLTLKAEIERSFMDSYKRRIEIRIVPDMPI